MSIFATVELVDDNTSLRPCRLCHARAELIVLPGRISSQSYAYCASCVNDAMERAEIKAAHA